MIMHKIYKVKERLCRQIKRKNWYINKSQHWGGNRQISMEGIDVEYVPNSVVLDSNETKSEFC